MTASVATLQRLARFYKMTILALFDAPQANPSRVRPAVRKLLEAGSESIWSSCPGTTH